MEKISKIYAPRQQITLTGEEAELILSLKVALERKLGFKISTTKVVRIALNKLATTEFGKEIISTNEPDITGNQK